MCKYICTNIYIYVSIYSYGTVHVRSTTRGQHKYHRWYVCFLYKMSA